MTRSIKLVGIDCGSTTTSAVVATARLTTSGLGRTEITEIEPVFRSELVFTPFHGDLIDASLLEQYLGAWLTAAALQPEEIFGGGALITGLAAQGSNAATIAGLIEARLADSVVAGADDPCLESWMAFMGNCHSLSRERPGTPILNLDIGGGTTNLAVGVDGEVIATGCLFVGARHFRFVPGSYRLTGLSSYAIALLDDLQIGKRVGDSLLPTEVAAVVDVYMRWIEAAADGNDAAFGDTIARRHVQVPMPATDLTQRTAEITLSGGVGQLVYDRLRGKPAVGTTRFGDLGGELAERISRSSRIVDRLATPFPAGLGRATLYGLLRHGTELSGASVYLPCPERLPLKNVPIVGRLDPRSSDRELAATIGLAARSSPAASIRIDLDAPSADQMRDLGNRLGGALQAARFPRNRTLVLLVSANLGKVLGSFITRWETLDMDLIVIDEVPDRNAQFLRLGRPRQGIVPMSLYGIR